jgi:hypothetical protein
MASSTNLTKPPDDQSKKTLEAVHQSKEVKTRSFFGNISGKPVKQDCHPQIPHTRGIHMLLLDRFPKLTNQLDYFIIFQVFIFSLSFFIRSIIQTVSTIEK